jgi:hypothetical protein
VSFNRARPLFAWDVALPWLSSSILTMPLIWLFNSSSVFARAARSAKYVVKAISPEKMRMLTKVAARAI